MTPARPDVDGRAHECAGAGDAAEQGSGHITHALSDKLSIAVVMRSGDAVRDE